MQLRVGDKVKFLNEVGEGTVVEIMRNNQVKVETEDGFEIPCLISDLILADSKKSDELFPSKSAKVDTKEPLSDKEKGKSSMFNDDSALLEGNVSAGFAGLGDPDGERVVLFLALVPENPAHPTDGKMNLFLINDGCYRSHYVISKVEESSRMQPIAAGMLEPDTKILVGNIPQSDLPHGITLNVQLLFFKNKEFVLKPAEQFNISISSLKLLRPGAYVTNDFFDEKVMVVKLTEKDSVETPEPEKIREAMLLPKSVEPKGGTNPGVETEMEEVDLHIEELVDDYATLSAGEILNIQLARFTTSLEGAIRAKAKRIVFIHGVGNGKLKFELRKLLDTKYSRLKYQDASFKEYGYGATLVLLK